MTSLDSEQAGQRHDVLCVSDWQIFALLSLGSFHLLAPGAMHYLDTFSISSLYVSATSEFSAE